MTSEKELARHRVRKPGNMHYWDMEMTPDEVITRRAYLRQILRNTSYCNQSNDILDNIRLTEIFNGSYLYEDEKGNEFLISGNAITKEEVEYRKCRSMIPFEFIGYKAKDFNWNIYNQDMKKSKSQVNDFVNKFEQFRDNGMGLYIHSGTKGSGKTMLACCILNELSERYPIATKFINSLDLLEMTKQTYKKDEGAAQEDIQALYNTTVLVIDDIGVQMSKEWIDTVFYRLINSRYNNKLVTIYTSNVEVNSLKMDDRIVDRIEATTYLLRIPEEPIRSRKREQKKNELLEQIKIAP